MVRCSVLCFIVVWSLVKMHYHSGQKSVCDVKGEKRKS